MKGLVVGADAGGESPAESLGLAPSVGRRTPVRWALPAVLLLAVALACLPGRTRIPPDVGADYYYQLIAAERFHQGLGLTSLQPKAPNQPWTWRYDYGWLTQWPPAYSLLVVAVRRALNCTAIEACQWINVVACAAALVGWFIWVRRCVPRGVGGTVLAVVGAGSAVPTASLINPATDTLLVALLPYVLLLAVRAGESMRPAPPTAPARAHTPLLDSVFAGLACGGLVWIRYAAVFVPLAVGAYLALLWLSDVARVRRRQGATPPLVGGRGSERCGAAEEGDSAPRGMGFGVLLTCAVSAALPVLALMALHRVMAPEVPAQEQLNLGHRVVLEASPRLLGEAWWTYTALKFYDYHWFGHWVFALWPAALLVGVVIVSRARRAVVRFLANPATGLSGMLLVALLGLLVGSTAVFGDKYHYTTLERYYLPGRPLYFVLFVAPLLLTRGKVARALVAVGLLLAAYWTVGYEWRRPYQRWLAAGRPVTPYGCWATAFSPGADALFEWLKAQAAPEVVVVSNFHDHLALETGIPAVPLPDDPATLDDWSERIRAVRGVPQLRILFVLDPDNHYRSYFLPPPEEVVRRFGLEQRAATPSAISAWVYEFQGEPDSN
ncbi:MAG TPA: hypothetical protein PKK06_14625 [Phycisphaerae bacterium]|nr:hypothetical protein [Phycisphaerae bacterium]HNU46482.1 hypothetical protein [Phycisphaerae bacterium]